MIRCDTCGKLIDASKGVTTCRACRDAAMIQASEDAPPTEEEEREAEGEELVNPLLGDRPCARCRKNQAMVDSEFCLTCQLELLSILGDAAHDLTKVPPPPPKPPVSSSVSLMRDLEDKRERTATSHLRIVGATKLK